MSMDDIQSLFKETIAEFMEIMPFLLNLTLCSLTDCVKPSCLAGGLHYINQGSRTVRTAALILDL